MLIILRLQIQSLVAMFAMKGENRRTILHHSAPRSPSWLHSAIVGYIGVYTIFIFDLLSDGGFGFQCDLAFLTNVLWRELGYLDAVASFKYSNYGTTIAVQLFLLK